MPKENSPSHALRLEDPANALSDWTIYQVDSANGAFYEVRDSRGKTVATGINNLQHARLFALSPILLENFDPLCVEASRSFHHMVDANEGTIDLEEVADDEDGDWEESTPGAVDFAQWLLDMDELREAVGEQTSLPVVTECQAKLLLM